MEASGEDAADSTSNDKNAYCHTTVLAQSYVKNRIKYKNKCPFVASRHAQFAKKVGRK